MYTKRARIDSLEGREEEDERERETERYGTIHFDNRVTFLFFFINATEMQSKEGDDSRLSSERQIGRRAV